MNFSLHLLKVQVFYVSEYPEAGMGSLVESKLGLKLVLTIKPSVTISTEKIRKLDINDRFCYFPDEQTLSVSASYSQKSCLIECRLRHLKKVCNCRPFFFNMHGITYIRNLIKYRECYWLNFLFVCNF